MFDHMGCDNPIKFLTLAYQIGEHPTIPNIIYIFYPCDVDAEWFIFSNQPLPVEDIQGSHIETGSLRNDWGVTGTNL